MRQEKLIFFIFILAFIMLAFLIDNSSADPLDNWHLRYSSPLNGVTYGNGIFVAVGDGGAIVTSVDGINWTSRTSVTSAGLYSVTYGNGIFVAVGENGTVVTSAEAITWTSRGAVTTEALYGVTYGNGIFVAVGEGGAIVTSADGITWTSRGPLLSVSRLYGVAYVNGTFVAVGDGIVTSTDVITWTLHRSGTITTDPGARLIFPPVFSGVTYGNGTFVAAISRLAYFIGFDLPPKGYYGGGTIRTSADGATWTPQYTDGYYYPLLSVAYGNGTFVAVGGLDGAIVTSADGITWTLKLSGMTDRSLRGVTYGNGTFVAVGSITLQSDPLSGNCTATLSSNLSLHIPIISFSGTYLWGDMLCEPTADGSLMCRVTDYGAANPTDFSNCQASTLTADNNVHIPAGIYYNISYQVDFAYVPTTDGQMWCELVSVIKN